MVDLEEIRTYLEANPGLYKIGLIDFDTLDYSRFKYQSLKQYTVREIMNQRELYPENHNWDIIFLCVAAYMSEQFGESTEEEIKFNRRPAIAVRSLTLNDTGEWLVVEPGHQRVCWAKTWGFKRCEFIVCDVVNRFDLPTITDPSVFVEVEDQNQIFLGWMEFEGKNIFRVLNRDTWHHASSMLERLCRGWTKEKICFELRTSIKLDDQQLAMIDVLADTNHRIIRGNGWEITNYGDNLGSTKYYNYPRQ